MDGAGQVSGEPLGTPSALDDPSVARELRKRRRAVIAWLVGGGLLVATFPVLQSIAHDRERQFTQRAELVTAHVQKTDSGSVWVGYELNGWRVAELNVVSSGAYDPDEAVRVLVDRSNPENAHLPGEEVDFLGWGLGWAYTVGWMGGVVLIATAIFFGRRTWRTVQLLRRYPWRTLAGRFVLEADRSTPVSSWRHPWRTLGLRWDSLTGRFVGEFDGTPVSYASPPGSGNRTVEVAGPTAPRDGNRSVMRLPPDAGLHFVTGPLPTLALPEPPDRSGATLFTESRVVSNVVDGTRGKKRQITTCTGTPIASLDRNIGWVEAYDTGGLLFALVGQDRKVTVLDGANYPRGTIHFRLGRPTKLFADGSQVGAFRVVDSRRDQIVAADGTELAQITRERRDRWRRPSRDSTTVWVRDDLPASLRTLVTAAALTARWRPLRGGGGA